METRKKTERLKTRKGRSHDRKIESKLEGRFLSKKEGELKARREVGSREKKRRKIKEKKKSRRY